MAEVQVYELSVGAEEVTGSPLPWEPEEALNQWAAGMDGVVTMETRWRAAERTVRGEDEKRWRKLFPEIKDCVIVVTRLEQNLGGGSGDPELRFDWMEPLELDDGSRRFVKKLEVKVDREDDRLGRDGRLRLCQSADDVTADPAHCHRRNQISSTIALMEHDYSSQSQDSRMWTEDSCSTEKKNLPILGLRKVGDCRWIVRPQVKEEQQEQQVEQVEQVEQINHRKKTSQLKRLPRQKRQTSCGRCAACLREDCGKCSNCLDKRKFGGPAKKKQRCQHRRCLVTRGLQQEVTQEEQRGEGAERQRREEQRGGGGRSREEEEGRRRDD